MKKKRALTLPLNDHLTVTQVAKELGYTEEWVRDLIALKELKAMFIGRWRIHPNDLMAFINSRKNI